jgi:hypothetical protein
MEPALLVAQAVLVCNGLMETSTHLAVAVEFIMAVHEVLVAVAVVVMPEEQLQGQAVQMALTVFREQAEAEAALVMPQAEGPPVALVVQVL